MVLLSTIVGLFAFLQLAPAEPAWITGYAVIGIGVMLFIGHRRVGPVAEHLAELRRQHAATYGRRGARRDIFSTASTEVGDAVLSDALQSGSLREGVIGLGLKLLANGVRDLFKSQEERESEQVILQWGLHARRLRSRTASASVFFVAACIGCGFAADEGLVPSYSGRRADAQLAAETATADAAAERLREAENARTSMLMRVIDATRRFVETAASNRVESFAALGEASDAASAFQWNGNELPAVVAKILVDVRGSLARIESRAKGGKKFIVKERDQVLLLAAKQLRTSLSTNIAASSL